MKKVVFFGGIVLLLAAVIIILLTSRTQQKKISTALSTKKEATPFVLTLKSGVVEYRKSATDTYTILATGSAALPSNSMVKTGIGTAEVLLENGSLISVDENTEITLGADSTGIKIQQFLGNTWHRVQKLLGVQTYQVITPTAVATVRGTKFGVKTLVGISKIITTENTVGVQLRTISPEGKVELGKEEPVSAGNESEIYEAEREVIIQKISPEEKDDPWFKQNEEFDKKYDEKVEKLKKEFEKVRDEEEKTKETKNEIQEDRINLKEERRGTSEGKLRKDDSEDNEKKDEVRRDNKIRKDLDSKLEPSPTRRPLDEKREDFILIFPRKEGKIEREFKDKKISPLPLNIELENSREVREVSDKEKMDEKKKENLLNQDSNEINGEVQRVDSDKSLEDKFQER